MKRTPFTCLTLAAALMLGACAGTGHPSATAPAPAMAAASVTDLAADRTAIKAMAGDYKVTFHFIESAAFVDGYELKEPKKSGAYEVVRVIEERPDFISLQHILVVGDGKEMPFMPIKHWRQDWTFEPSEIPDYVGANTWVRRDLSRAEAKGKWSQVVYQVDDAPRYAGLAAWSHEHGEHSWASNRSWRPLPRRDATTRSDYHAIAAVNRHAITPTGWVHEQDNQKLILTGNQPQVLAHEVGINTYKHFDGFDVAIATDYLEKTEPFWALIRAEWTKLERDHPKFGLTIQGEPMEMYMPILGIAGDVADGKRAPAEAAKEAIDVLKSYVTLKPGTVRERLAADSAEAKQD
ncbi:DUF6607 family protein [Gimibacter soli]|uniref:Lipoprotein n=1 Tax=Gimibacter soli TaxID=3024400 RepID=A0AAE9XV36_9PROT|nr:DUF6607 family protein [Gimibacter soli]WCL54273.1 hypothetical protein PH603_00680 [Gimibacter soli]